MLKSRRERPDAHLIGIAESVANFDWFKQLVLIDLVSALYRLLMDDETAYGSESLSSLLNSSSLGKGTAPESSVPGPEISKDASMCTSILLDPQYGRTLLGAEIAVAAFLSSCSRCLGAHDTSESSLELEEQNEGVRREWEKARSGMKRESSSAEIESGTGAHLSHCQVLPRCSNEGRRRYDRMLNWRTLTLQTAVLASEWAPQLSHCCRYRC